MAINFPDNPTINDEFSVDNFSWIWNGTTWDFAGGAAGGATITASATAPLDPQEGEGWFNTSTSVFSIYYNSEWVEVSGGASISASDIPPSEPELGEAWYNSSDGRLYIYYDSFWVEANPALVGDPGIVASATAPENLNILWLDTSESSTAVLPAGGTAGQKLIKSSDTSYDTQWADLTTSDITDLSVSSTELNYVDGTTSNIQNQIDTVQSNVELRPLSHNHIINGAMDLDQRVGPHETNGYSLDRWYGVTYSLGEPADISQVSSGLQGFEYALRMQRPQGNTAVGTLRVGQALENEDSQTLIGQEVTFSAWIRVGSDFSGSSVQMYVRAGDQTDIQLVDGASIQTSSVRFAPATTEWQRFFGTTTVSSSATQVAVFFQYGSSGTAGANDYFEITGVQLEAGSVATLFKRHAPSLQGELAACQRYYQEITDPPLRGVTSSDGNAVVRAGMVLQTTMRAAPTATMSGTFTFYDGSLITTSTVLGSTNTTPTLVESDMGFLSAVNALRPALLITASAGKLKLSAEL